MKSSRCPRGRGTLNLRWHDDPDSIHQEEHDGGSDHARMASIEMVVTPAWMAYR